MKNNELLIIYDTGRPPSQMGNATRPLFEFFLIFIMGNEYIDTAH